jgi:hypothetical protein
LYSSDTPRQSSEKLIVDELGNVCLKEHSKPLLCRPSSLLACRLSLKQLGQAARGFNLPFMVLNSGR